MAAIHRPGNVQSLGHHAQAIAFPGAFDGQASSSQLASELGAVQVRYLLSCFWLANSI